MAGFEVEGTSTTLTLPQYAYRSLGKTFFLDKNSFFRQKYFFLDKTPNSIEMTRKLGSEATLFTFPNSYLNVQKGAKRPLLGAKRPSSHSLNLLGETDDLRGNPDKFLICLKKEFLSKKSISPS